MDHRERSQDYDRDQSQPRGRNSHRHDRQHWEGVDRGDRRRGRKDSWGDPRGSSAGRDGFRDRQSHPEKNDLHRDSRQNDRRRNFNHDDRHERRHRDRDDRWKENDHYDDSWEDPDQRRNKNRSDSFHRRDEDRHHRHGKRMRMSESEDYSNRRPRFPAPFEFSQADYILDPATGYFYEEWSDFFHDPKSKLYFHNRSKRYYSFDIDDDRYINVEDEYGKLKMKVSQGEDSEVAKGNELIVQALQGSQKTDIPSGQKKISIKIKQKPKKSKKSEKKESNSGNKKEVHAHVKKAQQEPTHKQRLHHDNMEKWSKIVKEDAAEDEASPQDTKCFALPIDHSALANPIQAGKIKRTKSGKPVCLLCMRKFASVEKLEQHVLLSEYHKYNLSEMNINSNGKHANEYVDRAQNRRTMYEKEQQAVPLMDASEVKEIMAPSLETSRDILSTQTVRPDDTLGSTNIGSQMLQKLGWKEGQSLGKFSDVDDGKSLNSNLKNDWKKIESMAARTSGSHRMK